MRSRLTSGLALGVMVALCSTVHAQTTPPAPLPPAAQAALEKGLAAARVPDYPLAIRHFEEARRIAPGSPIVFFNLGLAESRMSAREMRAIAWFGAYLAEYPDAPNAAQVRSEIATLQARSRSVVSQLLGNLEAATHAANVPYYGREDLTARVECKTNARDVALLWVNAGDVAAALQLADEYRRCEPFAWVDTTSDLMVLVAWQQAGNRDLAGAFETMAKVAPGNYKARAEGLRGLARHQGWSGDKTGARRTLTFALDAAKRLEAVDKAFRLAEIAETQAEIGDTAGALATIEGVDRKINDADDAFGAIAKAQWEAGDVDGARRTARRIKRDVIRRSVEDRIREPVPAPSAPSTRPPDRIGYRHWLGNIDARTDSDTNSVICPVVRECPALGSRPFTDLSRHLATIAVAGDANQTVDAFVKTARDLVAGQRFIAARLAEQFGAP